MTPAWTNRLKDVYCDDRIWPSFNVRGLHIQLLPENSHVHAPATLAYPI